MAVSRRDLLMKSFGTVGLLSGARLLAQVCSPTHPQGEGPFYPEKDQNRDNDLVGNTTKKDWRVILLTGQVMDVDCRPIPNAHVEIWQAAQTGRYSHSGDPNTALKLDPDFQYWGRTTSDADGKYGFKTIVPGHYPLDPQFQGKTPSGPRQFRPPHIHFKARANGFLALTTQMYFDPKSYDDADEATLVSNLNRWENVDSDLTVLFSEVSASVKSGTFDIVLRRPR